MSPKVSKIHITDDAAKFVPTATLGSIYKIDIIAAIRIIPRTKPTIPPTNPMMNQKFQEQQK